MKPYQAIAILLALYIFAAWLDQATADEVECFTDSCVCVDDCLTTKGE